jgi:hypothetical protein
MSTQQAVHDAVYAALSAALGTAVPVYDRVPEDAPYPFVQIASHQATPDDTFRTTGFQHHLDLAVWSQYRGKTQVQSIMSTIYVALHNARLTLANGRAPVCRVTDMQARQDGGETYQGAVTLSIFTQN